jgi:uncharacterized membrane-anchored protein
MTSTSQNDRVMGKNNGGIMKTLIAAIALFVAVPALADQPVLSEQQRTDEIRKMHWVKTGAVDLDASKSSISLPPDYMMISGPEARRFDFITNAQEDPNTEAVVANMKTDNIVFFQYLNEGFITTDDWSDVDASKMLADIRDNTEAANAERRKQNIEELHVVDWLQQPVFDRQQNVVFWTLRLHAASGDLVNAIALRLGRYGYEEMIWVTDLNAYRAGPDDQKAMLQAHSFDSGAKYADHIGGDKLAGYGIASLVAVAAGAKLTKLVGFAALLLLAKKFGIVILAAVAGAIAWVKRQFSRKSSV